MSTVTGYVDCMDYTAGYSVDSYRVCRLYGLYGGLQCR